MNSLGIMLPSVNKECPLLLQFLPGREVQLKKKALHRLKVMLAVSTAGYGQLWLFSLTTVRDEGSSAFPTACLPIW